MAGGGDIVMRGLDALFGNPELEQRKQQVLLGALAPSALELAFSGSDVVESPEYEKMLGLVGAKEVVPLLRRVSAENRGAFNFVEGLKDTVLGKLSAPPTDEQGQLTDLGKTIPLQANAQGQLSNPANPFGGILSPPQTDELSARLQEIDPALLELTLGVKPSSAANRQGFGPDFNRYAFDIFKHDPPYSPEEAHIVNAFLDRREIGIAGGKAGATSLAEYNVNVGPAGGGEGTSGPQEGETRAEYEARVKQEGASKGRLPYSEKAVEERTGAATIANSLSELAAVGARLAIAEPSLLGRGAAILGQKVQSAAGEADIKDYEEMKQSLATILARQAGEKGNLAEGDIKRFINNIPEPNLPLATQIRIMQSSYRRIYTMAVANAQARGIDPAELGLPPPESVPAWYGAYQMPDGSYVTP